VDTDIFRPVADKSELRIKHGLPNAKKIIVFAASNLNDSSKGINYILEAAKILETKNYLFVGLGKGELPEAENIKGLGYIYDQKELAEIYALGDVFCFASAAETFLLSAAEALSCGVPVVGFDLPVVRELVNSAVGVLTESSSQKLAETLDFLMLNESLRGSMGQKARQMMLEKYAPAIFYSAYREMYNF
jgi:glycosyltransferase involved in cell wall biosynthesis